MAMNPLGIENGLQFNPIGGNSQTYNNNDVLSSSLVNANNTLGGFDPNVSNSGLDNAYQAQADTMNQNLENQNSTWGKGGNVDQGLGMAGKVIGGISSLANIYLGFQNLGMAKDELKIKKDQWKESKAELNHMRATRARIGQSYTTGSAMAR